MFDALQDPFFKQLQHAPPLVSNEQVQHHHSSHAAPQLSSHNLFIRHLITGQLQAENAAHELGMLHLDSTFEQAGQPCTHAFYPCSCAPSERA
jgi:hypothetical protein